MNEAGEEKEKEGAEDAKTQINGVSLLFAFWFKLQNGPFLVCFIHFNLFLLIWMEKWKKTTRDSIC